MERKWTPSQELAIQTKNKLLLVSAAAGSGKTAVLTERIIRSLTDPDTPADISRLLVVTFTRSAAAELRSKIASALSEAMAKDPANEHLSRQLFLLGNAKISTIDSFFGQVVRSNFEALGLPSSFRVADEGELADTAKEILANTISNFYEANEPKKDFDSAFEKIGENPFAAVMDHIMKNRDDKDFDQNLLSFLDRFSAYPEGVEKLAESARILRLTTEENFLLTPWGRYIKSHLQTAYSEFSASLAEASDYLLTDPDASRCFSGAVAEDTDFCQSVLSALQSDSYRELHRVLVSYTPGNFPRMNHKPLPMEVYHALRNKIKDDTADFLEKFFSPNPLSIEEQCQKTADVAEMLAALFRAFKDSYLKEKRERGVLEFNDIRESLYRLLVNEDGSATPFAETLSESFDAVYIDEYQDVDFMQDEIFARIGKEHRFMVGDIKQSIYGFRGSEPSIFAEYRNSMPVVSNEVPKDAHSACIFMSNNFRCNRPVIDYANRICGFLFRGCGENIAYRKEDDLICSKEITAERQYPVKTYFFEGYPNRYEEEKSPREAIFIANEIRRMIREDTLDDGKKVRAKDIAVLVRSIKDAKDLSHLLRESGISVTGKSGDDPFSEPLMIELRNLLSLLDNPYRDLPLSEYLLSPNAGFTPEELMKIRASLPESKSLFDAMLNVAENRDTPLGEKTGTFTDWVERYRTLSLSLPADRFLNLLYLDPRLAGEANDPSALYLYELARNYQKNSFCGLYGFLEHLQRLSDGGKANANGLKKGEDAVRITTIHDSKGLEFPIVFLFGVGKTFNWKRDSHEFCYHRNTGFASTLFLPEEKINQSSVLLEATTLAIKEESAEEDIRVLYVALTRAKERLVVSGTLDGKLDSALSKVSTVRDGSRHMIFSLSSYLQWILAVIGKTPADYRYIPLDEEIEIPEPLPEAEPTVCEEAEMPSVPEEKKNVKKTSLQGIPTKIAASKISPDLVDRIQAENEDPEGTFATQLELLRPSNDTFDSILDEQSRPDAAEIGTATHLFLESCDFKKLSETGLEKEIDRLVTERFLPEASAKLLNRRQLEAFLASDLMQAILSAKEVRREQKFALLLPLEYLTENRETAKELGDDTVFVQGSIDLLLFDENGDCTLYDYKTDRITEEEAKDERLLRKNLLSRHGNQLSCYALAVKKLFGKAPASVALYSLPLGRSLFLDVDCTLFEK